MEYLSYKIHLQIEPEGGYTVFVPDLPGCITWGKSVEHAALIAYEAIDGYIAVLNEI